MERQPSTTLAPSSGLLLGLTLGAALLACVAPLPARGSPRRPPAAERVLVEVHRRAHALDAPLRARIAHEIVAEAERANLDPLLVVALIHVESSFDRGAVSRVGATGLMQLRQRTMTDVAARSRLRSTDPLDPVANVQAGVRYLARLNQSFGDAELALMAYNAGPGRIRRYLREGGVPERFRAYPRSVARELARLGGSPFPASTRARVAVPSWPRTLVHVHQASPARAAFERAGSLPGTGPREVEHSREPRRSGYHLRYEYALASRASGRGLVTAAET